jgi:L-ascorbate metabolism protein UlaG (beta-lactamase superfamily)
MHYDTFDVIQADPEEFAAKVPETTEVRILKIGDSTEV